MSQSFESLPQCRLVLKEWLVVCHALRTGRQTIVVRKGGIAEPAGEFQTSQPIFWLTPTQFHQRPEQLRAEDRALTDTIDLADWTGGAEPEDGAHNQLRLPILAHLQALWRLTEPDLLSELGPRQILADDVLDARFNYRESGLHVLALRVYRPEHVPLVPNHPRYEGCKSWVELDERVPIPSVTPVLDEQTFSRELAELASLLPESARQSVR